MKLLIMGAQGSGKGTAARDLSKRLNVPTFSPGDMFKQVIAQGGEFGEYVASFVNSGVLVPDELSLKVVLERLSRPDCKNGYILDGYPRTLSQVKLMKGKIDVDKVIYLKVDQDLAVKRLTTRMVCPKCGNIYNLGFGGDLKNCSECGTAYIVRSDDTPEAIKKRLQVYYKDTMPVVEHYKDLGIVLEIDANNSPEDSYSQILKGLGLN